MDRPAGSNADEWCLFLSEHSPEYAAVQIAEAIEQAEREACERVETDPAPLKTFRDSLCEAEMANEAVVDTAKAAAADERARCLRLIGSVIDPAADNAWNMCARFLAETIEKMK